MDQVKITHFSDILCIWAYIAEARIREAHEEFAERLLFENRFCSVFGDTKQKMATVWKERGRYQGFNAHLMDVAKQYPHITVHPDIWLTTRPESSASPHLFLKAVARLTDTATCDKLSSVFRQAFFRECRNISDWEIQCEIAEPLGVNIADIENCFKSGIAHADLSADYQQATKLHIEGSPTYILNHGRQRLFGNVGYRILRANITELLHEPSIGEASWC